MADVTTFDGQLTPTFRGEQGARFDGFDVLTSASISPNSPDLPGSFLGSTLTQADPTAIITSTQNIYNFSGPSSFELSLSNDMPMRELSLQIQLSGTGVDPASVHVEFLDAVGMLVQVPPTSIAGLNPLDPGEVHFAWNQNALAGLEAKNAHVQFNALAAHMSLDVLIVDALFDTPALASDVPSISLAAGGAQVLELEVGANFAGQTYWLVGSASGTSPGLDLGGALLPLNYDSFTTFTLTHPNSALLQGTLGTIDAEGLADAAIVTPPGLAPSLAGVTLHFAAVVLDSATSVVDYATNPTSLTLLQ